MFLVNESPLISCDLLPAHLPASVFFEQTASRASLLDLQVEIVNAVRDNGTKGVNSLTDTDRINQQTSFPSVMHVFDLF